MISSDPRGLIEAFTERNWQLFFRDLNSGNAHTEAYAKLLKALAMQIRADLDIIGKRKYELTGESARLLEVGEAMKRAGLSEYVVQESGAIKTFRAST